MAGISNRGFSRWKGLAFEPSLADYREIESVTVAQWPAADRPLVGGDWHAARRFLLNLGTGFNRGAKGPGIVLKSRLGWHSGPEE